MVPKWLLLNFPPTPEENSKALYLHLIMNWGKMVIIILFCIWSMGTFAPLGFGDGFARAGDVSALREDVRSASVSAISSALFQMRRDQCAANGQLREMLQKQIVEAMREYHRLVGQGYPLPACGDLS